VPTPWRVESEENILWRTTLPETGQSGIAVWEDRIFLTTMKPLADVVSNMEPLDTEAPKRREDAWNYIRAFDANTGKPKWTASFIPAR